ncbi:transcriptional Coactivator p15-domain-containing protein [Leucosporidium creatinivorum]|uniref:Transcriptional Coactivator p15-domain-containing protein n=1 Tax=Leucosporidium creatinivorum TaxID=106004 RepID=A0A1Y2FZ43_9BASI|nr:transcriptional Coactivator p15-domain-containing protein [Leucosporidium creatinivorum]
MVDKRKKDVPLSQEYVNDSDDSASDKKPTVKKSKKVKKEPTPEQEDSDSDSEEEEKMSTNDEGDRFLRLSNNRRVTVRQFKGKTLVDIRETYEKDGKDGLPGKKGISLNAEQFQKLKQSMGLIDEAIKALK